MASLDPNTVAGALMYTDRSAKVVYVNLSFVQMMSYDRQTPILGRELYDVLGVEQSILEGAFVDPNTTSEPVVFEIQPGDRLIRCVAEAAYDETNKFMGWNFKFSAPPAAGETAAAGSLPARSNNPVELIRIYTTEQISAVQTMLARLIGFGVRDRLEDAINALVQAKSWPVYMDHGELSVSPGFTNGSIYEPILAETIRYAVQIIGERKVRAQMEALERTLDDATLAAAEQAGLRQMIPT